MGRMTVGDVISNVRDAINEAGTTAGYWNDSALYRYIFAAQSEIAADTGCIRDRLTFITTTTGTRGYSIPSGTQKIYRITCNGTKLQRIDMDQFDLLTNTSGLGGSTVGTPQYYVAWGVPGTSSYLDLEPIPSTSFPLMMWRMQLPTMTAACYATGTNLEVPDEICTKIEHFVLWKAFQKGQGDIEQRQAIFYAALWEKDKQWAKDMVSRRESSDRYLVVRDVDDYASSELGMF